MFPRQHRRQSLRDSELDRLIKLALQARLHAVAPSARVRQRLLLRAHRKQERTRLNVQWCLLERQLLLVRPSAVGLSGFVTLPGVMLL